MRIQNDAVMLVAFPNVHNEKPVRLPGPRTVFASPLETFLSASGAGVNPNVFRALAVNVGILAFLPVVGYQEVDALRVQTIDKAVDKHRMVELRPDESCNHRDSSLDSPENL